MLPSRCCRVLHHGRRSFSSTPLRNADFTHAVIGAGAVGLAIARRLQQVQGAQVVLIEKHGMVGSETSSRNSEVRYCTMRAEPYRFRFQRINLIIIVCRSFTQAYIMVMTV